MRKGIETPWGIAYSDETKVYPNGILRVHTASHGGLFVPADLLHRIPEQLQEWAAIWSGSKQWYEEDCCWAAVVVFIPEVFPPDHVDQAHNYLMSMKPDIAACAALSSKP